MCLATAGLLMGCVEGGGSSSATGGQTTAAPAFRGGSAREVEAPDVFQTTDSALWDGRPSLGGIWVASPDATEPERVVILNPATGKSVNGALFRRERDNPGPRLQVSSDAAEALGMLAGQPTSIRVTALRKANEAPPPAAETAVAAAAPAATATEAGAEAPTADTAAADTAALATAALAATGTAVATAADATPEAAATAEGAVEAAATEAPKPKTWKERRAEAKARREAEKAAKAAAAAAAAAATTSADAEGVAAEPAATAGSVAVATVETAPLDARTPEVTAAADAVAAPEAAPEAAPAPKKTRRQIREEQKAAEAAAAAAAATAAAEATTAAPQPAGAGRTIQIASFSKEENATRAIQALAKVNVTAQAQKSEQGGTTVWGVVATGDDALLASIKKAGFADAFFLN
jgi:hypothetical protein